MHSPLRLRIVAPGITEPIRSAVPAHVADLPPTSPRFALRPAQSATDTDLSLRAGRMTIAVLVLAVVVMLLVSGGALAEWLRGAP